MIPRGDEPFLETPWYGSHQMARHMMRQGHKCGRHRVRHMMRLMRLVPIYQEPNTSKKHLAHKIHPYQRDHPAQAGLVRRHHLYPHGAGCLVSGHRRGLV